MKPSSITIVRVFDAPVETVWQAWSDSNEIKKWWGPKDFTCPAATTDFRVGGKYLFCMRGSAGPGMPVRDFWSTGTYQEIIPLKKIVYHDSFADEKGKVVPATYYDMPEGFAMEMQVTVLFEKEESKTKMTLTHVGHPGGQMSEFAKMGWNQSLDKMAATF